MVVKKFYISDIMFYSLSLKLRKTKILNRFLNVHYSFGPYLLYKIFFSKKMIHFKLNIVVDLEMNVQRLYISFISFVTISFSNLITLILRALYLRPVFLVSAGLRLDGGS